jgi:hypothetical protein
MAFVGLLALLIVAMVTLSMIGAERNFRRSLEDWAAGSGGSPAAGPGGGAG